MSTSPLSPAQMLALHAINDGTLERAAPATLRSLRKRGLAVRLAGSFAYALTDKGREALIEGRS